MDKPSRYLMERKRSGRTVTASIIYFIKINTKVWNKIDNKLYFLSVMAKTALISTILLIILNVFLAYF